MHLFACAMAAALLVAPAAFAVSELDLTGSGSNGTLNGSLFYQFQSSGAGAGSVDEFVRYQAASKGVTEGYNTDGSPFQYDEVGGGFTHSILLSAVPQVSVDGTTYREFAFDINESGGTASFLSLDEVEIYLANSGSLLGHPGFGGNATLVWDLDSAGDSRVLLDFSTAGGGGGSLDMLMYVPDALFTSSYGPDPYLILYSRVGEKGDIGSGASAQKWSNSDGQEAWVLSVEGGIGPRLDPAIGMIVPEPATALMLAGGLVVLGWSGRTKRRHARR